MSGPSAAFDFPGSYEASELSTRSEAKLAELLPADRRAQGTHTVGSETTVNMLKARRLFFSSPLSFFFIYVVC